MARTRSTSSDDPAMQPEKALSSEPITSEQVVEIPPPGQPPAERPAPLTPRQLLTPPAPAVQAMSSTAAAGRAGLVHIGKEGQLRQVHPVDVADWLALGWRITPVSPLGT